MFQTQQVQGGAAAGQQGHRGLLTAAAAAASLQPVSRRRLCLCLLMCCSAQAARATEEALQDRPGSLGNLELSLLLLLARCREEALPASALLQAQGLVRQRGREQRRPQAVPAPSTPTRWATTRSASLLRSSRPRPFRACRLSTVSQVAARYTEPLQAPLTRCCCCTARCAVVCSAQRMGYSPLLNAGLSNAMLQQAGAGALQQPTATNFAPQQPAFAAAAQQQFQPQAQQQQFQPQAQQQFAAQPQPAQYTQFTQPQQQQLLAQQQQHFAAAAAPQQQLAGGMQTFQMQPGASYPYPYAIPAGNYQPTASPAAMAAANTGFNNLLTGFGQGMTNLGRNMAAGPPPSPVTAQPVVMAAGGGGGGAVYTGATLRGTYPGVGSVDLGVPRVGAGGVNPIIGSGGEAMTSATSYGGARNPSQQLAASCTALPSAAAFSHRAVCCPCRSHPSHADGDAAHHHRAGTGDCGLREGGEAVGIAVLVISHR